VTLAVGLTSMGLNVCVLTRAPATAPSALALTTAASEPAPAAATSAGWSNPLLMQAMAALVRRVDALEAQAQKAQPQVASQGRERVADKPEVTRYVRFELPSKALGVKQDELGNLSVSNTDPALTGKLLMIKGEAEDGTTTPLSIVVPAPGK
jgi:hypothetical protein